MTAMFNSYTKGFEWLSNFWPCELLHDGLAWPSAEHAYQGAKTDDPVKKEIIRTARSAGAAKRMGKHLVLRDGWEADKVQVMREVLNAKFALGSELCNKLVATGNAPLVHLSPWDRFWGVGNDGVGENTLGKILMELREQSRP